MASPVFLINGVSLEALGVESIVLDAPNMGEETVSLKIVDRDHSSVVWLRKQKAAITCDGRPFFTGWISRVDAAKAPNDRGCDVTVSGPWWWLTQIIFGQEVGGTVLTSISLFVDRNGEAQDVRLAMREALDYARVQSGGAFAIGTIEPENNIKTPQPEYIEALYCDAVVKKVSAWCPSSCLWVDHTQTVPVINWTAPGARKTHTLASGTPPFTAATLTPESTIAPEAVIVRYDPTHASDAKSVTPYLEDRWPEDASVKTPGAAVITLGISDVMGPRLARQLYESARVFLWSGTASLERALIDVRPGDQCIISGRPEWSGCRALVQRVKIDLARLATTLTFGPPSHLGAQDLLDLFWWIRTGGKEGTTGDVSHQPFEVFKTTRNGITVVQIAPGYLNTGDESVSPTWNGVKLDAKAPNYEVFTATYFRQFYLFIEWKPDVGEFSGTDNAGQEVTGYRAIGSGTARKCEVRTYRNDNIAPVVNVTTGAVARNGEFYFPLATARAVDGSLDVTQNRSSDVDLIFVPPNNLWLVNG